MYIVTSEAGCCQGGLPCDTRTTSGTHVLRAQETRDCPVTTLQHLLHLKTIIHPGFTLYVINIILVLPVLPSLFSSVFFFLAYQLLYDFLIYYLLFLSLNAKRKGLLPAAGEVGVMFALCGPFMQIPDPSVRPIASDL